MTEIQCIMQTLNNVYINLSPSLRKDCDDYSTDMIMSPLMLNECIFLAITEYICLSQKNNITLICKIYYILFNNSELNRILTLILVMVHNAHKPILYILHARTVSNYYKILQIMQKRAKVGAIFL